MEDYENYVKEVLKIPYCNLKGVHPRIAYEMIVGLSLMYEMYPLFNRVISSIGNINDLNNKCNELEGNSVPKVYFEEPKTAYYGVGRYFDEQYNFIKGINNKFKYYVSIVIYENVKNKDVSKINNIANHHIGRISMYHEFGHILDQFLHISNSYKLKKIIKGHDIKKEISEYACTNNKELVAEAFCYYIFSKMKLTKLEQKLGKNGYDNLYYNPSNLVKEIGKFIDEKYQQFAKLRQVKYVNGMYNFNQMFTIDKTKKPINVEKIEERFKIL